MDSIKRTKSSNSWREAWKNEMERKWMELKKFEGEMKEGMSEELTPIERYKFFIDKQVVAYRRILPNELYYCLGRDIFKGIKCEFEIEENPNDITFKVEQMVFILNTTFEACLEIRDTSKFSMPFNRSPVELKEFEKDVWAACEKYKNEPNFRNLRNIVNVYAKHRDIKMWENSKRDRIYPDEEIWNGQYTTSKINRIYHEIDDILWLKRGDNFQKTYNHLNGIIERYNQDKINYQAAQIESDKRDKARTLLFNEIGLGELIKEMKEAGFKIEYRNMEADGIVHF